MSGYLHRLVNAVSQPRQTIHSRTGSLFSPYRGVPDSSPGFFEQAETVTVHPAPSESPKTFESAEPVDRPAPFKKGASATPRQRPARSHDPPSPLVFEADEPHRADVTRPTDHETQRDTVEHAVHGSPQVFASNAEPVARDTGREAGVENYEILLHPQTREANNVKSETPRFFAEAASEREAKSSAPADGRSARPERQPDEIQIHIGRIEVTAVQPPAPRAPKAPGRGISLEAYLERRNGSPR